MAMLALLLLRGGDQVFAATAHDPLVLVAETTVPVMPADTASAPTAAPVQQLTVAQQVVAFGSGAVIKPLYMLLSVILFIVLRREKSAGLVLLRQGMLWFFVGEAFCAVDYYCRLSGPFSPFDLLHGLGMVAMSVFIPWGIYRLLDERFLHFSDPAERCLAQRFCGRCAKREAVRCGLHDLMLFMLLGLAVVALMPWSSALQPTRRVAMVFSSAVEYGQPIINQIIELRVFPIIGGAGLLLTFGILLLGGPAAVRRAEPVFYVSIGFTSYPLLRHLLMNAYRDQLYWSDFWEETTELLMILGIGLMLYVFRGQLGLGGKPAEKALEHAEPESGERAGS